MSKVTSEEFIKAYMSEYRAGGNIASLAANLGVTVNTVYFRIRSLNKHGVTLPALPGSNPYTPARVAHLNKLVKDNSDE